MEKQFAPNGKYLGQCPNRTNEISHLFPEILSKHLN